VVADLLTEVNLLKNSEKQALERSRRPRGKADNVTDASGISAKITDV
jgi:hypothetical protein